MGKGILFNGAMVRAIIDGRKTVTRRPVKKQPDYGIYKTANCPDGAFEFRDDPGFNPGVGDGIAHSFVFPPYAPGDRVYVRETWRLFDQSSECPHLEDCSCPKTGTPIYRASYPVDLCEEYRWYPSIHMPKQAARIWMTIASVRPERTAAITEEDARREGFENRNAFINEWAKIYGDDFFEWVWRIEFKDIEIKGEI